MRILVVRFLTFPGGGAVPSRQAAARLRQLLPERAPAVVSHVSVVSVDDDAVELAVFLVPGLAAPRLQVRAAAAEVLSGPGFEGWVLPGAADAEMEG